MTRDQAKAKVAKLMAMGNSPSANENEAETALRQAASLMKAHAIEQTELMESRGDSVDNFEWTGVCVPLNPKQRSENAVGWLGTIGLAIGRFTDTVVSYKRVEVYGMALRFQGEAMDVEYAAYLAKHLRDTVRRMSAAYPGSRRQREDYRAGMVARLGERMKELKEQMRAELDETATTSGGTALAIVDRKCAALAEHFGTQKTRRGKSRAASHGALNDGRAAGNRVGFGRPVGGPSQSRTALTGASA